MGRGSARWAGEIVRATKIALRCGKAIFMDIARMMLVALLAWAALAGLGFGLGNNLDLVAALFQALALVGGVVGVGRGAVADVDLRSWGLGGGDGLGGAGQRRGEQ